VAKASRELRELRAREGKTELVNAGLGDALYGRIVREQAKGIVAERAGLDIEGAFSRMRAYARDHNVNVIDVALGLVDGTLNLDNDDSGRD
jgi:AmiR/NasT family two-component response regulator